MKISDSDRNLLIMLLKKEATHKKNLVEREPKHRNLLRRLINRCDRLVVRIRSEESLLIDSQKPKITIEQMNELLDSIDYLWAGKRPSFCADGSDFEQVYINQTDLIKASFTIISENNQ